jgi:hypothetical protein
MVELDEEIADYLRRVHDDEAMPSARREQSG